MGHPLSFPMGIAVRTIGAYAQELLREGATAVVVARTSRALFLAVEGEMVWVSAPAFPHRRALLAARPPVWPEGLVLHVEGRALLDGAHEPLHLGGAAVWSAPALPPPPPDLTRRAHALARPFAPALAHAHRGLGAARVAAVHEALRAGDGPGLAAAARNLLGCGPGLTPLGDDFLGGVFFALRAARCPWWPGEVPAFLAWARARTPRLSHALLADLSQGHGPEPLHALTLALFTGAVREAQLRACDLLGMGQSTGAGLLAGVLAVWSALS